MESQSPIDRRRRSSSTKSLLCMPRFRGTSSRKSARLSPMSLLERFREAVFRLIMLSALSKASSTHDQNRTSSSSPCHVPHYHRSYIYAHDPHHSEAVAECIEFIKKSATPDESLEFSATSPSMDGAPSEVVIPLPVM